LKPAKQCQKAANTTAAVLKTVQRNFHYRDKLVFVPLYKQYVRPHLEFAVPAWLPWLEADKNILESVQKKAVKWVSGLASVEYEDRCKELGLETLEVRRWQQDMTQVYKILRGIGNISEERFFYAYWRKECSKNPHGSRSGQFSAEEGQDRFKKELFFISGYWELEWPARQCETSGECLGI
jgi:hypothetical protein